MGEEQQGGRQGFQLPAVAWGFDEPEEAAQEPVGESAAQESAAESAAQEPVIESAAQQSAAEEPAAEEPAAAAPTAAARAVIGAVPEVAQPTATATATAIPDATSETVGATEEAELEEVSTAAPGAAQAKPGRISRPMVAAAVTAGLVLVGLPLAITQFGGSGSHHGSAQGGNPVGFSQQGSGGGGNGYVPGFDSHGDTGGPTAGAASPAAGAVPVAADGSGSPSPSSSAVDQPAQDVGSSHAAGTGAGAASNNGSTGGSPAGAGSGSGGGSGTAPGGSGGSGGGQAQQPPAQAPAPAQTTAPAPPAQPPAGPQPTVQTLVAGPYCSDSGTSFHQHGWFSDGSSGWRTNSGGWTGDQCNGRFSSVPMSGDANKDDGNSVVWSFTGLQTASGSCDFAVYVPASSDVRVVGGAPTYYTVQTGTSPGSGTIGSFTVDQVDNQGSWVDVGNYPVSDGQLSVMLHTRGLDWTGNTKTYAHHAADAVRATCSS